MIFYTDLHLVVKFSVRFRYKANVIEELNEMYQSCATPGVGRSLSALVSQQSVKSFSTNVNLLPQ